MPQAMYLRFVIRQQSSDSRSFVGLFTLVYDALENASLQPHEQDLLQQRLSWFKMHLKVPACFKQVGNERAICWFKPEAHRPIELAWEMISVLRECGHQIELIKTADPGTILYEDGWQIVAKPHHHDRLTS